MQCHPAISPECLAMVKCLAAVGGEDAVSLGGEDAGEDDVAAAREVAGHLRGELHQRAGEDVGDDQIKWRGLTDFGAVKAAGGFACNPCGGLVQPDVITGDAGGDGVDVGGENRDVGEVGGGDGKDAGAGAKV